MERIAIYGKGGIGKSVIATNISMCLAVQGRSVLHVGCDPKHDSAVRLLESAQPPRTVLDMLGDGRRNVSPEQIINRGRRGITCIESGGPEPGVGCAGRGVARTLEVMASLGMFQDKRYEVCVFDVLGDVVCGGFAAPLREGFARKVVIVTSEEAMSLYAANNICKAVRTYAENGVTLAGLVANLHDAARGAEEVEAFARLINTSVLATLSRDPKIQRAERAMTTMVEREPNGKLAALFDGLARKLLSLRADRLPLPEPLEEGEFFRMAARGGE